MCKGTLIYWQCNRIDLKSCCCSNQITYCTPTIVGIHIEVNLWTAVRLAYGAYHIPCTIFNWTPPHTTLALPPPTTLAEEQQLHPQPVGGTAATTGQPEGQGELTVSTSRTNKRIKSSGGLLLRTLLRTYCYLTDLT